MKLTNIPLAAFSIGLGATIVLPALAAPNPERDAYFGETHIHTSWSVDAWVMGKSALRRLGLRQGRRQRPRLGEAILRWRRSHGRGSACHASWRERNGPDVRGLGGEGPDLG